MSPAGRTTRATSSSRYHQCYDDTHNYGHDNHNNDNDEHAHDLQYERRRFESAQMLSQYVSS